MQLEQVLTTRRGLAQIAAGWNRVESSRVGGMGMETGRTGRSLTMEMPEERGESGVTDVIARIERALQRGEAAADRLDRRHRGLRAVAQETVAGLDRLIEAEKQHAHG